MTSKLPVLSFPPPDPSIESNADYSEEMRLALRVGYHHRKGIFLASQGALTGALQEFDTAIKQCPTFGEAWYHRGLTLGEMNRFDLAYEAFAQAAFLTPGYDKALQRIAVLGPGVGRPAEILTPWAPATTSSAAQRAYHKIAKWWTRSAFEQEMDVRPEAELRRSLTNEPHSAELANALGLNLDGQYRFNEAEHFFRYALMLKPWMGSAAVHLCNLLERAHRLSQAGGIAEAAMEAGATDIRLPGLALWSAIGVADWTNYKPWLTRTIGSMKHDVRAATGHAISFTDDPELLFSAARLHSAVHEDAFAPLPTEFRRTQERPLTLGYISADFRDHPVARLSAELFELHDRKRFRVYGYGLVNEPSDIGARIKKSFDKYAEVATVAPRTVAERIIADRVDILIDLTGNMLFGPKSIIARRPAPVQVNYLGHPGTTGSRQIDYVIVDRTIVPPEQQKWFTEALVYMPECHQVNDRKRAIAAPKSRAAYGLPPEGVVYCSFNETRKITPDLFDMWMRILARVPGSVLWLASYKKGIVDNLRRRAAARGVDVDRVIFAERVPEHADHMARYLVCDLYLDTLLYNGHTTCSDALWAGCPAVTVLGASYQTRVAASLLKAIGLPENVMPSPSAYEEFAVRVGHDADLRRSLRRQVEANRGSCVLFDTPRFTRHLEWAYEHMWERYVAGQAPSLFDVPLNNP